MLNDILNILKDSKADAWDVTDELINRFEFYFIKHSLDQYRCVDTEHINVTVYKKSPDGKYLGSATEEIDPTASIEETKDKVETLLSRASLVKNPLYSLRKPVDVKPSEYDADPSKISRDFIETLNNINETETLDINCYEIFASSIEKRHLTSEGIDTIEKYPVSFLEVVTNARDDEREIELYRSYDSGTCDKSLLKKDIEKTLAYGRDRLLTEPTPDLGKVSLMLSTADALQVWNYFADRINAGMVYQKASDWKQGEAYASDISGDKVTLSSKKFLPNSSKNSTFDDEGALIRDETLIFDGVVKKLWGNQKFSSYLGLDDTFILSNYEVAPGSSSEADLRAGKYLEVVEFSDFQVDSITGDIFGEIRLGYLHDGSSVKIVSGGSVSGSMRDCAKSMHFSSDMTQYNNARVPSVVVLDNVTLTGAE
ncbi:MAG: TldD/PmbA family protein [Lachnospiraceae bacterium]|uniref:TldD/PmbA family protein n=1 Tax=Candidatus Weimeria bifida TaxID=2599074 RepID=A0A6N7IYB3_9FIRM|nr:TldD/PmbA family protein [Candidatus Weimeria bifida]RRF95664.1 MAG: TldD/PmbA family protein [Lachnospiraceae bacterium]